MFKRTRVRFFKNGKKYITHSRSWGRKSPYNSKSWKYNGKRVYL